MAKAKRITGRLVYVVSGDTTLYVISGQNVNVKNARTNKLVPRVQTDLKGKFTASVGGGNDWVVEPPTSEQIERTHPDLPELRLRDTRMASITVTLAGEDEIDLRDIVYEVQVGTIHGILTSMDNKHPANTIRLQGARVALVNLNTGRTTETITGGQGMYYFNDVEPGVYVLQPAATLDAGSVGAGKGTLQLKGAGKQQQPFGFSSSRQVDFTYGPEGGDIHGVVFVDKDANKTRFGGEKGLSNVPVVLADLSNMTIKKETTRNSGDYWLPDIPPGDYQLLFEDTFSSAGNKEYTITTNNMQKISVKAGETAEAAPTGYQPEVHEVRGQVVFDDNQGVPGLVVSLLDQKGHEVETAVTDDHGNYVFKGWQGDFTVTFPETPFSGQLLTPKRREVHSESVTNVPAARYRRSFTGGGGQLPPQDGATVQSAVLDIASYPLLTEGTGLQAAPSPTSAPGTAALGQTVDNALKAVLGWRPKMSDSKGFLAALNQSFDLKAVDGRTRFVWTPRSYAVQADMGAITGAQASIYARAKNALDQASPLLDGLYALDPAADPQDVEAERAIVRSDLTELVNELGVQGGPRVSRVDSLFLQLLGPKPADDPEAVGGELSRLRDAFGLIRSRVNTVDEEQNYSNYLIVVDHGIALFRSWDSQRGNFTGTGPNVPYLGTQLVLLSRALAVVAESVREANFAMDSVFLESAERQTIQLDFTRLGQPPMVVGDLMDWVDRFASTEGPRLIDDGGKRGVLVVAPTLDQLRQLMRGALVPPQNVRTASYRTARVQRALAELADSLDDVFALASQIK